jgi:predicted RNase H-like nuclease (RuvC/YqgF family)
MADKQTGGQWQERRQQLLDGDAVRDLAVPVLKSVHDQALEFAKERDCSEEEALRLIFCYGLAYLRGEAALTKVQRADTPQKALEELEKTARQMMEEATHAASLKFQAYRLAEDNQVLEMRSNAMTNELLMARNRMSMFRDDEDRLKARVRELEQEQENLRLRAQLPGSDAKPARPPKKGGLLRILKK